ncbi:MAG: histidine kinase [Ferruginibacter sp.]
MDTTKHLLKPNESFARVEFWASATIFAFILYFFIANAMDEKTADYKYLFREANLPFDFYTNYFIPQMARNLGLFLAFLFLNFMVVPQLVSKKRVTVNVILFALVLAAMVLLFGYTGFYLRRFLYAAGSTATGDTRLFFDGLDEIFAVLMVFIIYTFIKYTSRYLIANSRTIEAKYRFIKREGTIAAVIFTIVLLLLIIAGIPRLIIACWIIAVPSAILLYLVGFYSFIPASLDKKYPFVIYELKNAAVLFVVLMAWGLILKIVVGGDQAHLAALWIFNSMLQLFITAPVIWILYKRQMKGNEQLNVLKKELGQSNASFDFLRSQINPHFLFNALNTLYGTAMHEKAERTSEGIQKLGDMMRFMMRENMQEKISLNRELEYLNNYINLQKLRTDTSPGIRIITSIPDSENSFQVAPMLLIPFVENAFKHGISFREPSYIKVSLELKNNSVDFKVHNSKHIRPDNDPEKNKSGIGLENVKQRLKLLYPGKHVLSIEDTDTSFFIQLTLEIQ